MFTSFPNAFRSEPTTVADSEWAPFLPYRFYEPSIGQFTTLDPYVGDPNNPQSLNKYLYANGDPVNGYDPTGRDDAAVMALYAGLAAWVGGGPPPTVLVAQTARPLTQGEIALARKIFGNKIDYTKVKVIHNKAYFFQQRGRIMTPDGNIYAPDKSYSTDYFTKATPDGRTLLSTQALFLHEMTHVWQSQQGMWVKTRGLNRTYDYNLDEVGAELFTNYGIEQQAMLVQDYYTLSNLGNIYHGGQQVKNPPPLANYEKVLKEEFPLTPP